MRAKVLKVIEFLFWMVLYLLDLGGIFYLVWKANFIGEYSVEFLLSLILLTLFLGKIFFKMMEVFNKEGL